MHRPKVATDIRHVDTMDAYRIFRGPNDCIQGLVELAGFLFLVKESVNIFAEKSSNHINNGSVDTDTRACVIGRLEWRVAEAVMNFIDNCINVNNRVIDVFHTLEKSNSATC